MSLWTPTAPTRGCSWSQDRHQVRHLGAWQDLPDHPDRFDTVVIVLGREGFTSGRHYWEVQVGDKDDWYLGVARSSVNRKGRISVSATQGYWALAMKKGHGYRVSTSPPLALPLEPRPGRVGVYVDHEEGQVSFYDVRARTHIYTFQDAFTEKISAFFLPVLLRQSLGYHRHPSRERENHDQAKLGTRLTVENEKRDCIK